MEKIQIGILGCGTVGTGVVRLLERNREDHQRYTGCDIRVKRILVSDLAKERDPAVPRELLTDRPGDILEDPEIGVVLELVGGCGVAREYVGRALDAGKNVVTANKDLMADAGGELFARAASRDVDLLFEASVGGGIPIIAPLKHSLAANRISRILGIVNGTTNFILSKMVREGMEFSEALGLAQSLGYAEADPTADVEGYDAARKIAILASIAFHTRVRFADVYVEGITRITQRDIEYAHQLHCTVKLVGLARETGGRVEARVHPVLLPLEHPLAKVDQAYNAVYVEGDAVGDVMFQGPGAGADPTASAVVGDLLAVVRNIARGVTPRDTCSCYGSKPVMEIGDTFDNYFIRMTAADRPGVLAQIAGCFGDSDVSIDSVIQKKYCEGKADLVLITERVRDRNLQEALGKIEKLEPVMAIENLIRVER